MSFGGSSFIVAIVLICTAGWIFNNWIRARHGYPLENEWGGTTPKVDVDADRKISLLSSENEIAKRQDRQSGGTYRRFGTYRY